MRRLEHIIRSVPLIVLLSLSVTVQALVMARYGLAASVLSHPVDGNLETIIICSGGELREVAVDENGQPVEGDRQSEVHCPLCLAASKSSPGLLQEVHATPVPRSALRVEVPPALVLVTSREPDSLNCLDPPTNV